jgi:hypothetical protein
MRLEKCRCQKQDAQPAGLIIALRTTGSRHWMEVTREGRLPNAEIELPATKWCLLRTLLGYVCTWRRGPNEVYRPDGCSYAD